MTATPDPGSPAARLRFGAAMHVKAGAEFAQAYKGGVRDDARWVVVYGRPNGLPHARLGQFMLPQPERLAQKALQAVPHDRSAHLA